MIRMFLLNLFMAGIYVLLTDDAGPLTFATGFVIGYFVLTLYGMATGADNYGRKMIKLLRFAGYFLTILTKANLQIAWEIITPDFHQTPRILRYPVHGLSPVELTTLSNCITLTPGTLVIDVSDDNNWLYIHNMYAKDRDAAIAELDELAEHIHQEVFS